MSDAPWEDCKVCGGDHWTKDHAERARPVPPEGLRVVAPFTDEHDRAEDHVSDMLAAYLNDRTEAERAANDVMARLHLSGYDFVKRRPLAASSTPQVRCPMVGCPTTEYHDHGSGHAMREMTPEPRSLVEAAQGVVKADDDDPMPSYWLMHTRIAALRAALATTGHEVS